MSILWCESIIWWAFIIHCVSLSFFAIRMRKFSSFWQGSLDFLRQRIRMSIEYDKQKINLAVIIIVNFHKFAKTAILKPSLKAFKRIEIQRKHVCTKQNWVHLIISVCQKKRSILIWNNLMKKHMPWPIDKTKKACTFRPNFMFWFLGNKTYFAKLLPIRQSQSRE